MENRCHERHSDLHSHFRVRRHNDRRHLSSHRDVLSVDDVEQRAGDDRRGNHDHNRHANHVSRTRSCIVDNSIDDGPFGCGAGKQRRANCVDRASRLVCLRTVRRTHPTSRSCIDHRVIVDDCMFESHAPCDPCRKFFDNVPPHPDSIESTAKRVNQGCPRHPICR
jgi:hypothetical protein